MFPILSATDIPEYSLRALKVLHSRLRYELTNQANRITKVWPGDGEVYKASDYLLEPFRVACCAGVGAKLQIPIQSIDKKERERTWAREQELN